MIKINVFSIDMLTKKLNNKELNDLQKIINDMQEVKKAKKVKTLQDKIYSNIVSFNEFYNKDTKNELTMILTNIAKNKTMYENNEKELTIKIDEDDYNDLVNIAKKVMILKDEKIDFSNVKITYKDIKKAIQGAYGDALKVNEKYLKMVEYTPNLNNFFKTLQANIVKKIENEKRQDYLQEKAKKDAIKKDKEKAKARKKANKQVEKKQIVNNNLKTKID
jgi:hypothetical protein